jgi:hypothetical protein
MATSKFWVVMGTGGLSHSPFKHYSEDAACKEAERLARNCGGTFFVLESKAAAARVDVKIERFDESGEIPF